MDDSVYKVFRVNRESAVTAILSFLKRDALKSERLIVEVDKVKK